jgi:hypothetical protein
MVERTIKLGGRVETLRATPRAFKAIDARFGNVNAALASLAAFEFGAYVAMVAAGLGRKADEKLEEEVFEANLTSLIGPLSALCYALANGGVWETPDEKKDETPAGES